MHATTVEQSNIELVRRGYEAFNNGDAATLTELFRADAQWIAPPTGILTGTYHDRNEIFAMFQQVGDETHGTFRAVASAFAAGGNLVFVKTLVSGQRKGKTLSSDEVLVFTIADGKVAKTTLYLADFAAEEAFWS